jgi:hypothetical protein
MTTTFILIALALLAVLATVHTVRQGGRPVPPRSHPCDDRFAPPMRWCH